MHILLSLLLSVLVRSLSIYKNRPYLTLVRSSVACVPLVKVSLRSFLGWLLQYHLRAMVGVNDTIVQDPHSFSHSAIRVSVVSFPEAEQRDTDIWLLQCCLRAIGQGEPALCS